MSKKKSTVGLWITTWLLGLTFIALSIYLYIDYTGANIPNSVETKGVVYELYDAKSSRLIPKVGADDYYESTIPKVEFTTLDGNKIQFLEQWAVDDQSKQYSVGQEVTVYYNSEFPEDAQIKKEATFSEVHIFLILFGIFLLFFPLIVKKATS